MTGAEALAWGLAESGVRLVTGVPGYPVTGVLQRVRMLGLPWLVADWSVNEKAAAEMAAGCSVAGWRAAVVSKHVGLNVAADPLVSAVTHRTGAGVLLLVGDDPEARGSWNAQDSRWIARLAGIPVFEPAGPRQARTMVVQAFDLSERIRAPVMLRVTDLTLEAEEEPDELFRPVPCRVTQGVDLGITWGTSRLGSHDRYVREVGPVLAEASVQAAREWSRAGTIAGVVSAGPVTGRAVDIGVPVLQVGMSHPIPEGRLAQFLGGLGIAVVAEDGDPVVEEQVLALVGRLRLEVRVLGRTTGHLPRYGRFSSVDLERALSGNLAGLAPALPASDEWAVCADCDYESLFQVLLEEVPEGLLVAGDAGCSLNAVRSHPGSIDLSFGLGSAVGVASGLSLGQGKSVAVIGDMGFLHSGVGGLLNAVHLGAPVLVVLLDNGVAAQTGGQARARVGGLAAAEEGAARAGGDLTPLLHACGLREVTSIGPGPDGKLPGVFREVFRRHLSYEGSSAILIRIPCKRWTRGGCDSPATA